MPRTYVRNGVVNEMTTEQEAAYEAQAAADTVSFAALVPSTVTPRQFRRALSQAGLRASVEAAIAAADEETRDTWEYAVTIERGHPMLIAMATALDVTSEQLDDLFRLAATL